MRPISIIDVGNGRFELEIIDNDSILFNGEHSPRSLFSKDGGLQMGGQTAHWGMAWFASTDTKSQQSRSMFTIFIVSRPSPSMLTC